jgi:hypothetical protein
MTRRISSHRPLLSTSTTLPVEVATTATPSPPYTRNRSIGNHYGGWNGTTIRYLTIDKNRINPDKEQQQKQEQPQEEEEEPTGVETNIIPDDQMKMSPIDPVNDSWVIDPTIIPDHNDDVDVDDDPFGVLFKDGDDLLGPTLPPKYQRDAMTGKFTGVIEKELTDRERRILQADPIEWERMVADGIECIRT